MSTWSKLIRQPLGTILPLSEVKRRVIVDVHDKCGGNYLLAPPLLGIGRTTIYRLVRMYRAAKDTSGTLDVHFAL